MVVIRTSSFDIVIHQANIVSYYVTRHCQLSSVNVSEWREAGGHV